MKSFKQAEEIEENGFSIIPNAISGEDLKWLATAVEKSQLKEGGDGHASRGLFAKVPDLKEFLRAGKLRKLLEPLLGPGFFAVKAILFNKLPEANWRVAWHQDLTIAVKKKVETSGFGPWSIKAGVQHVQAPDSLLKRMIAVRIHLDDCLESNGPLKVLPGSHLDGRLNPEALTGWLERRKPFVCSVAESGVLLMRPLLLHASSSAINPSNRRVIHIEFAVDDLPSGLEWFERH